MQSGKLPLRGMVPHDSQGHSAAPFLPGLEVVAASSQLPWIQFSVPWVGWAWVAAAGVVAPFVAVVVAAAAGVVAPFVAVVVAAAVVVVAGAPVVAAAACFWSGPGVQHRLTLVWRRLFVRTFQTRQSAC